LASTAKVEPGEIVYRRNEKEVDVLKLSPAIRANFVGATVQQPLIGAQLFNPVLRIWDQALDTASPLKNDKQLVRQRFLEILRLSARPQPGDRLLSPRIERRHASTHAAGAFTAARPTDSHSQQPTTALDIIRNAQSSIAAPIEGRAALHMIHLK
jgi:hypothetical protein